MRPANWPPPLWVPVPEPEADPEAEDAAAVELLLPPVWLRTTPPTTASTAAAEPAAIHILSEALGRSAADGVVGGSSEEGWVGYGGGISDMGRHLLWELRRGRRSFRGDTDAGARRWAGPRRSLVTRCECARARRGPGRR